jgi:predicted metal-dependent phosphoesterase TrpH
LIDLHTHTTASDGRCTPEELAARAAAAGVTTLGLTDHDTVGGCAAAAEACSRLEIDFVAGIEITAVTPSRDVHVLGYFIDLNAPDLQHFLAGQRRSRADRVREMFRRLADHGIHLDADSILAPGLADPTRAIGRPWIARALVAGGHVSSVAEAFDRWLGRGRPAFVPRTGAAPHEVFALIHDAGGLASLAHPVLVGHDEWIPGFADAGLDALEAFHSDHSWADTERYLGFARQLDLVVTGGSDYHADDEHGGRGPGSTSLPREHFERLLERSRRT